MTPEIVWRPPCLADAPEYACRAAGQLDLRNFAVFLRQAEILDTAAFDLSSSSVVLPYGNRVFDAFAQRVETAYFAAGLGKIDLPTLVPSAVFDPIESTFSVKDLAIPVELRQRRDVVLLSSTEYAVYDYLSRRKDLTRRLPVRWYRRSRFFRDVAGGGKGLFRQRESVDVLDFHCLHPDRMHARTDFDAMEALIAAQLTQCGLSFTRVERPLWTNHGALAERIVAFDVLLPGQGSVQIASLYEQGNIFPGAYGIRRDLPCAGFNGYLSRRAVLAALMIGFDLKGRFFLPPALTPIRIVVHGLGLSASEQSQIERQIQSSYASSEYKLGWHATPTELSEARRMADIQAIPLQMLIFGKGARDRYKVVIRRSDTRGESATFTAELELPLANLLRVEIEITSAFRDLAATYARETESAVQSLAELKDVLAAKRLARFHLKNDERSVRTLEAELHGEILGFEPDRPIGRCLLTNESGMSVLAASRV